MNKKFIDEIYESKTGVAPEIFDDVELEEKQDVNFKEILLRVGSLEFRAKALSFSWKASLILFTCLTTIPITYIICRSI